MVIHRKVKRVIDGDTFETHRRIQGSNHVRIAGKNAPERHNSGGAQATQRQKANTRKNSNITTRRAFLWACRC